MASSKDDPVAAAEPANTDDDRAKTEGDLQDPPLLKRNPTQVATTLVPRPTYSGLPAFHLPPEGLGGVRLAAVWVA